MKHPFSTRAATFVATLLLASAATAAPLAILTDVSGSVQIVSGARTVAAKSGAKLNAGDRVISRGGHATIFYLGRAPQKLAAGGSATVAAAGVKDNGVWRKVYAGMNSGFEMRSRVGATVRAEGLLLWTPVNTKMTGRPRFIWTDNTPAASYEIDIVSGAARQANTPLLWHATITGTSADYPPVAPTLEPGRTYTWSVRRAGEEDETKRLSATFQVATAAEATSLAEAAKEFAALDGPTRRNVEAAYANGAGFPGKALELLAGLSEPAKAAARVALLDETGHRLLRAAAGQAGQMALWQRLEPERDGGPRETGSPDKVSPAGGSPVSLPDEGLPPNMVFTVFPDSARKTYADAKGAFSIEIPRSWGATKFETKDISFTELAPEYNGSPGITIAVAPKNDNFSAVILGVMKGSGPVEAQPATDTVFAGAPARRTNLTWELNKQQFQGAMLEFTRGDRTYVLGIAAAVSPDAAAADTLQKLTETLLPSFRTEKVVPGKLLDLTFDQVSKEMDDDVLPAMKQMNAIRAARVGATEKPATPAIARARWDAAQQKLAAQPTGALERVEAGRAAADAASDLAWTLWQSLSVPAAAPPTATASAGEAKAEALTKDDVATKAEAASQAEASALYARSGALRRAAYEDEVRYYEAQIAGTDSRLNQLRGQTVQASVASGATMLMAGLLDVQAMRLNHLESQAMDFRDSARQLGWAVREAAVRREQLELGLLSTNNERSLLYQRVQFARGIESIGGSLDSRADFVQADRFLARALAWRDALPTPFALRARDVSLRARGSAALRSGDLVRAREYYEAALAEVNAGAGAQQADADRWNNAEMSSLKKSDIAQSRGVILNNLGSIAHGLGDYAAAEKLYRAAYDAVADVPAGQFTDWVKASMQASALGNLSALKADAGSIAESMKLGDQAVALLRSTGDDDGIALWMANRAGMLESLGQRATAKQIAEEAHRLFVAQNRPERAALTSGFLARLARESGDLSAAQSFAGQSLEFARASRDGEAVISATRALAAVRLAQIPKAAPAAQPAMWGEFDALVSEAMAQGIRIGASVDSVSTLVLRADGKEKRGDLPGALADYREAVARLEATRATTTGSDFAESKSNYAVYEHIVRLLLKLNRPDEAFDYLSRARSKRLQDSLRLSSIQTKDPALQNLLDKAAGLEKKLGTLRAQLETENARPDTERDTKKVENLHDLVAATQAEFFKVSAEIRAANPNFDSILTVKPRELKKAQPSIPAGAVLIQYAPLGDKLYIFVVSRTDLKIYAPEVSARELMDGVRNYRALMTAAQGRIAAGQPLIAPENDPALHASLTGLYKMLIAPIEGELKGVTTVAFIPSGPLYYLPLHALARETPKGLHFLIEDVRVAYLAAADVLAVVQTRDEARMGAGMLALGDPSGANLPAAREEVREISKIFPAGRALIGDNATKSVLQDAKNLDRRVLHLATHGVLDSARPDNSYIQLAGTGEASRLSVGEVYGLDLNRVDLVTLSACQTALGERNPDGGEISSLAQAFSAAGTPSVIASLWSVEDDSTRRLMEAFYKAFAAGASKAEALQAAQKQLLADPKSRHPFYWAPFELMGDWR